MRRGEIYFADLGPRVGDEIKKIRPVLIISNNANNNVDVYGRVEVSSSSSPLPQPQLQAPDAEVSVEESGSGGDGGTVTSFPNDKSVQDNGLSGNINAGVEEAGSQRQLGGGSGGDGDTGDDYWSSSSSGTSATAAVAVPHSSDHTVTSPSKDDDACAVDSVINGAQAQVHLEPPPLVYKIPGW